MKNMQKRKLASDLAFILVLLVMLIQLAVAWFVYHKKSQVDGAEMTAADLINAGISLDDETYATTEEPISPTLPEALQMQPVTGDGLHLFLPATDPYTGDVEVDDKGDWMLYKPEVGRDYYIMDLYARADQPTRLSLESESTVTAEATGNTLLGENVSGSYVAGIVRIAFVDVTDSENLKLLTVWVPNNQYQLLRNEDGSWTFDPDGEAETDWQYFDGHGLKKLEDLGVVCGDYFDPAAQHPTSQQVLLDLPEREGDTDYPWWAHLKIIVWLEGMDRDAANAPQMGGNIELNLKFKLEPVPTVPEERQ